MNKIKKNVIGALTCIMVIGSIFTVNASPVQPRMICPKCHMDTMYQLGPITFACANCQYYHLY